MVVAVSPLCSTISTTSATTAAVRAHVVPHCAEEVLIDERGHGGRGHGGRVFDLIVVSVLARSSRRHARVLAVVVVGFSPVVAGKRLLLNPAGKGEG